MPSQPGSPRVIEETEDYITVHWKEPETDGNSPISNYILEMQERNEVTWQEVNKSFTIKDVTYKVTIMEKKKEYTFRVTAVNEVGKSKPSEPSDYLKLTKPQQKEPPRIEEGLKSVTSGRKQTITLTCVIRGTPAPTITWYKNDKIFKSKTQTFENCVAKYEITETTETSAGEYKVQAKNPSGEAESSCTVKIQERPEVEVEETMISQKLRVTNQWKVIVKYKGYPQPDLRWKKDSREILHNQHCSIYTEDDNSTIAIYSLERSDSGTYEVTASNEAGSASTQINLRVFGKNHFNFKAFYLPIKYPSYQ